MSAWTNSVCFSVYERESSQKKAIKVCVDDYLVRWHENQKNLHCFEYEFIIVHQAKCCSVNVLCVFAKFIDRGTLGVEG
jgi:hypothetical protein